MSKFTISGIKGTFLKLLSEAANLVCYLFVYLIAPFLIYVFLISKLLNFNFMAAVVESGNS